MKTILINKLAGCRSFAGPGNSYSILLLAILMCLEPSQLRATDKPKASQAARPVSAVKPAAAPRPSSISPAAKPNSSPPSSSFRPGPGSGAGSAATSKPMPGYTPGQRSTSRPAGATGTPGMSTHPASTPSTLPNTKSSTENIDRRPSVPPGTGNGTGSHQAIPVSTTTGRPSVTGAGNGGPGVRPNTDSGLGNRAIPVSGRSAARGTVGRVTETKNEDGSREIIHHQLGREGHERVQTTRMDQHGREVSRTVVVNNRPVYVRSTTVVNRTTTVVYDHGRYGYVYRPAYVVGSPVYASWYDPYWYTPSGVLITHPFHYTWGWNDYAWYRCHRYYWAPYEVYPAPSYWVTDWMIAGYIADRYATSVSLAQAQEELRLAQAEAEKATLAARQAQGAAELATAQASARAAENRALQAEAKLRKVEKEETQANKVAEANPNATPIDEKTKEALKNQIERVIAENKKTATDAGKGTPAVADVSKALAEPDHIYPVSSALSVVSAADQSPAGTLTEGDLLKVEPGQGARLANATENTLVSMRVLTSKGEEGEVKAGTVVSVPLKSLQDFDSEFRAKLDLGLAEAAKNQDEFKKGA